jgi:plastocyanin
MHRGRIAVVAAAGLLVMAGCGEKRETTTGGGASSSGTSSSVTISETEFKLNPASPGIAPGGTITAKNDGSTTHALEVEGANGEVKTKPLSPGQSATLKAPDKEGSYEMYCPIDGHKNQGMKGELKVGSGGTGSSGGSGDDTGGGSSGGGGGGY